MLNMIRKLSQKKCENCGVILQKDGTRLINLKEFELINYDKAIEKFRESPRPSYLIEVHICVSCHVFVQQILEKRRETEKAWVIQQQKEEEAKRYLEALRKQVELKTLEKQAIELGINLKEL